MQKHKKNNLCNKILKLSTFKIILCVKYLRVNQILCIQCIIVNSNNSQLTVCTKYWSTHTILFLHGCLSIHETKEMRKSSLNNIFQFGVGPGVSPPAQCRPKVCDQFQQFNVRTVLVSGDVLGTRIKISVCNIASPKTMISASWWVSASQCRGHQHKNESK